MSGWLAVAEKLWGRRASEQPSSYQIDCACGRQVSGTRSETVQVSFCAACGTALFVLPQSVYPRPRGAPVEPATAPASHPRRRPSRRSVSEPQEPAPEPGSATEVSPRQPEPGETAPRSIDQAGKRAPRLDASRPRRRIFTPVRLVLAGIALVIGLTVWGTLRISERSEAERTFASGVKLAQQALEENDLAEAAKRFQDVRKALDLLGRTDSRARELRQTAAEITAAADLAKSSLFDILHEAVATTARSGRGMWTDTFRSSYRDEWVLIDAQVSRTTNASGGRQFEIDFPLSTGADRVMIVGDLECFQRAVPGGSSRRVIFAAQLDDFSRAPHDEATWQIVLRPSTAFLWSAAENLERLGVEVDEETRQVLTEQSGLLGVYQ